VRGQSRGARGAQSLPLAPARAAHAAKAGGSRVGATLLTPLVVIALATPAAVVGANGADDGTPRVIDLTGGTGSFVGEGPLLADGNDLITFSNLPPGAYSYRLSLSGEGIEGLAASVNGQTAGTFTVGPRSFAGLEGRDEGSFTVQISGRPGDNARYQGIVSISPEPASDTAAPALLLGGLAVLLGWMTWRTSRRGQL